jgi:hypothetical protein
VLLTLPVGTPVERLPTPSATLHRAVAFGRSDVRNKPNIKNPKGYTSAPSLKVGNCIADKKPGGRTPRQIRIGHRTVTGKKNEAAVNKREE